MKKEKSCGAVVYRKGETGMEVLLIKHKRGALGIPQRPRGKKGNKEKRPCGRSKRKPA